MTPDQVKALSTAELVAKYNALTNKNVKRFATRADGERRVLAAIAQAAAAIAPPAPSVVTARAVRGSASAGRTGRPKVNYIISLNTDAGKSKPQADSDRMKLINWLKEHGATMQVDNVRYTHAAKIEDVERHFQKRMRGVVQKLMEKNWLKRIEVE
jgi:hypothetical protein